MRTPHITEVKMYAVVTGIAKERLHVKSGKMVSSEVWVFFGSRDQLPGNPKKMAYYRNNSALVKVDGECHVGDIITFNTDGYPWDKLNRAGRIIDSGMFKIGK